MLSIRATRKKVSFLSRTKATDQGDLFATKKLTQNVRALLYCGKRHSLRTPHRIISDVYLLKKLGRFSVNAK